MNRYGIFLKALSDNKNVFECIKNVGALDLCIFSFIQLAKDQSFGMKDILELIDSANNPAELLETCEEILDPVEYNYTHKIHDLFFYYTILIEYYWIEYETIKTIRDKNEAKKLYDEFHEFSSRQEHI